MATQLGCKELQEMGSQPRNATNQGGTHTGIIKQEDGNQARTTRGSTRAGTRGSTRAGTRARAHFSQLRNLLVCSLLACMNAANDCVSTAMLFPEARRLISVLTRSHKPGGGPNCMISATEPALSPCDMV
uniref:Uncharacterized protein n=1 Tax=Physcomitrium patens TaxID=3218 RepID=A0A2K1KJD8_PHYPA|nr:hypothetical protein PHYPA_007550 [Physcomitrium patens]